MSLDQIINITISRRTTQPSRAGFGTPLIAAYFPVDIFNERVRAFGSLSAMEDVGFVATDPAYKQAAAIFAQNPSPATVKVGRRATAPQQVLHVVPGAVTEGDAHNLSITGYADAAFASRGADGNYNTDTQLLTVTAGNDAEDLVDAWIATLAVTGDYTLTKGNPGGGSASYLIITADNTTMDGLLFGVKYTVNGVPQGVDDVTAGSAGTGLTTDLGAIYDEDPDWYGLCLDSNSQTEIEAAAEWVSSNKKILVAQTQDLDVANVSVALDTTSVAYTLKSNSYTQTMLFWHTDNLDYVSGAMLGRALSTTPGSITWAHKQLTGVTAQQLTDNQLGILQASVSSPSGGKDVNTVTSINSISVTRYGSSMQGEFMDVQRYADYLEARLSEDTYAALVNNDKIPLTDAGINVLKGIWLARLNEGVTIGALLDDPEPTVEVPLASALSQEDRANRHLTGCKFRAQLAGAVHFLTLTGELAA
jgi:hypothetical protein